MSVSLTVNGALYTFPEPGDSGWGQNVTDWASAVSSTTLQRTGGAFTLTADVDFGASFGLKSQYFTSRTANPATVGQHRLARADVVSWRNQANSANLDLAVTAGNVLTFGGTAVLLSGLIVNADVAAAAAIALSKLAALTTGRALQSNSGTGFIEVSAVTATELGYLSGVSSALQTQLGTKFNAAGGTNLDIVYSGTELWLRHTDSGAAPGPTLMLHRESTTPAAADLIGSLNFQGRNSAAAPISYAKFVGQLDDPVAGTEDGSVFCQVMVAGVSTSVAKFDLNGLTLPTLTASRALQLDGSSRVAVSAVTSTELGYLSGVTSGLQAQINAISGVKLLATYTPSAAASVDITSQITATYETYLVWFDLALSSDGANVQARTDTSNGASFDAGGSDYAYEVYRLTGGAVTASNSTGNSAINLITGAVGNATNEHASGLIWIKSLGSGSAYPLIEWVGDSLGITTNLERRAGLAARLSAATINAFQLLPTAGTITGTVRIYGLPKT